MKIGIIGAMDLEVEILTQKEMSSEEVVTKAGMRFHVGKLGGTEVVVARSGVGKVNAALCAQILIDCFGVTHLINTGIAGSLDRRLHIGDIVLSEDAVYHDVDVTALGFAPGTIPRIDSPECLDRFPADPALRVAAAKACREVLPGISLLEGRIASGDQFICTAQQKEQITGTFHALCAEMEGAAIAHTAFVNQVPFVILRAISDNADEEAGISFEDFQIQAAGNCARLTAAMVRSLSL